MSTITKNDYSFKWTTLKSAKFPSLYLFVGIVLVALSYIDDIFPLTKWKQSFDLTDKIGNVFIAFAAVIFLYNFIALTCKRYEKILGDKHKVASMILTSARKGLRILFALITIDIFINILGPNKKYLLMAEDIIHVIIIGAVGWLTIQIIYTIEAVLCEYMKSSDIEDQTRAKNLYTKLHIIKNIATVVIVIVTLATILMSFNSVRSIGISLLASAGFLTAIVGLSAQKTLFSLFSGLQIALTQPIRIGDIVSIDKESGIIEQINFTYVILKLGDKRRMIVPINHFIDKPFENWSHEANSLRSSLHFNVDFMMPIEPLREHLERLLKESTYWDGAAHKLQVANMNNHSVDIRIQVSASNADDLSDLRAEIREKMLAFMQTNYPAFFPQVRQI